MERINEFVNILLSDEVSGQIFEYFEKNKECLFLECRNIQLFSTFFRAEVIDAFLRSDNASRDLLFNSFKVNNIFPDVYKTVVDNLNLFYAEPGDNMEGVNPKDLEGLLEYVSDPLYNKISRDNEYIAEAVKSECFLLTMEDVKNSDPRLTGEYEFSPEEIKILEYAAYFPSLIERVHLLYDEMNISREIYCNYDLIEEDLLRMFAFHTDNDNDIQNIIDNNGRLIRYYQGDISFYKASFTSLVELTKLFFIYIYREDLDDDFDEEDNEEDNEEDFTSSEEDSDIIFDGRRPINRELDKLPPEEKEKFLDRIGNLLNSLPEEIKEDDIEEILGDSEDDDFEYESIDANKYARIMKKAISEAWDTVMKLSRCYSKRMIEVGKTDLDRIKEIARTYHL